MIGQLRGRVTHSDLGFIILDVAGVGYKVFVNQDVLTMTRADAKEELVLWTHLVVRETALDLYGFAQKHDLIFFEMLIDVSGIGPKTALAVLNMAPASTIERAILSGNASYLTKVAGIGNKSAQKIVLELKDKLEKMGGAVGASIQEESDALDALVSLGYSVREAREALQRQEALPDAPVTANARVKMALKDLSTGK